MRTELRIDRVVLVFALALSGCGGGGGGNADSCTPPCTAGTHCEQGACVPDAVVDMAAPVDFSGCQPACAAPTPYCKDRQCVACLEDANCPVGQVCNTTSGTCVMGCNDDARCNQVGKSGSLCCNHGCVDGTSDASNCGACGTVCTVAHAKAACAAGQCAPGTCDIGWGDCDHDPANGCETNLRVDPNNCGACGMACAIPNAITACSDGCYLAACSFGWDDCNGDPGDGCEQNVTSDMKNCGACGQPCLNKPHARNSCIASSCVITSCDPGYSDCNRDPKDGCEVSTGTDSNNCGACGNVCAAPLVCSNGGCTCPNCNLANAKSQCVNNQCVLASCLPGFENCDGNPANGCEVNLSSDVNNCGKCGTACPMGQTCSGGACKMIGCQRIGWKFGAADWSCPNGLHLPTVNDYNFVAPCIDPGDQAMFGTMHDIAVAVGGCNCKWNNNWCGQPSIDTMRQGRMCGDYSQLQICIN